MCWIVGYCYVKQKWRNWSEKNRCKSGTGKRGSTGLVMMFDIAHRMFKNRAEGDLPMLLLLLLCEDGGRKSRSAWSQQQPGLKYLKCILSGAAMWPASFTHVLYKRWGICASKSRLRRCCFAHVDLPVGKVVSINTWFLIIIIPRHSADGEREHILITFMRCLMTI